MPDEPTSSDRPPTLGWAVRERPERARDFQTASQGWRPGDQVAISRRDGAGASHTATATLSPGPPA